MENASWTDHEPQNFARHGTFFLTSTQQRCAFREEEEGAVPITARERERDGFGGLLGAGGLLGVKFGISHATFAPRRGTQCQGWSALISLNLIAEFKP